MQQANIAELFGAAQRLAEAGQQAEAATLYRRWVAAHPDDPLLHAALFNLAVLLDSQGEADAAADAYRLAAHRQPGFLPPFISLGLAHERRGEPPLALEHWSYVANSLGAVTRDGIALKTAALKHMSRLFEDNRALSQAEDALRQALELDPGQDDVLQRWLSLRQRRCAWPLLEPPAGMARDALLRRMAPLSLAAHADDPWLLLAHAAACSGREAGQPAAFRTTEDFAGRLREQGGRRRIGYLSSDLRDHAIGHLTADLFRRHDRAEFEVFVYDCGIAREDATKQRIRAGVEHWRDIIALDDAAALRLMRADGIDILIDVNGHTRGARPRLLAQRPAPVIVNWLGFPGTMGSPFHHYIIADAAIIPAGSEAQYSETVLRLPCYQPNDRHRSVAAPPSRASLNLPQDAIVFCCFNGAQKVTRFVFGRWMDILRAVPAGVLWLMQGGDAAEAALRAAAAQAGIAPSRLVFAPPRPNAEHVARYAAADLFLDTWPYGAHTTASDALWMGVPVLTVPGHSFAARVCASLVGAAGLPDLVCRDWDAYVSRAIALAGDGAARDGLRARLLAGREGSALFDTGRLVLALEDLFRSIWRDAAAGRLPIPDLTNLQDYLGIGTALDADEAEPLPAALLEARWRQALVRRHAYAPLPPDRRLWRERPAPLALAAE
jgi:predicted O-linked N-acetylglucosamine transferase (SPINDLY family)